MVHLQALHAAQEGLEMLYSSHYIEEIKEMKCSGSPCGQYISNKGHRYRLRQLFGALRSNQHEHKIRKALLWPKRFRRRERALLGFVLVVDLLEFAAVDAQAALG